MAYLPPFSAAGIILSALALPVLSADTTKAAPYRGAAYDTERKAPAYVEEIVEGFVGDKHVTTHTTFHGPDGKPMADRNLDFGRHDFKPDYLYRDFRNGYEEGAQVGATDIRVHFKDSGKEPLKEKRIKVPEPCVINGGVGEFVKHRWADIAAGKQVHFNMVIPARLDYFKFVAYVDRKYTLTPAESKGREYLPVVIEPKSTVLNMLLPAIVMYEDVKTKRLVHYQGIVNVADAKGRSLRVKTAYPEKGP
jgi:hypothetical protein